VRAGKRAHQAAARKEDLNDFQIAVWPYRYGCQIPRLRKKSRRNKWSGPILGDTWRAKRKQPVEALRKRIEQGGVSMQNGIFLTSILRHPLNALNASECLQNR